MQQRTKLIVASLLAFALGATGGGVLSWQVAGWVWYRISIPLVVATGAQALSVVTLLDKKDEASLRQVMELEIDNTLSTLRTIEATRPFAPDDPMGGTYERLKEYRRLHPGPGVSQMPSR